jgi:hypothetical protein
MAEDNVQAVLWKLRRNRVLTALMVYVVGVAMAAVVAAFAVWRSTPGCPIPRKLELQYVVKMHNEDPNAHTSV